jgi:prophage DNA circulation protein
LRELRVLVGDAIQQQALTLPEIAYTEVARDMPALVISHKLDSKANTTPNLITRNGIPHPLFCAGTLEYLRG